MNAYNGMYIIVVYTRKRITVWEDQFCNNILLYCNLHTAESRVFAVSYENENFRIFSFVNCVSDCISNIICLLLVEHTYMHIFFNQFLIQHTLVTLLCFSRVCTHMTYRNTRKSYIKLFYTCTVDSLRFNQWGPINVFFLNEWTYNVVL